MTIEDDKQIVRCYQEASNANDLDAWDALVAADLISHNATPGHPPGLEGGKMAHRAALAAFPDLHYHVEDLVAEGNKVVQRFTLHHTHQGESWVCRRLAARSRSPASASSACKTERLSSTGRSRTGWR